MTGGQALLALIAFLLAYAVVSTMDYHDAARGFL